MSFEWLLARLLGQGFFLNLIPSWSIPVVLRRSNKLNNDQNRDYEEERSSQEFHSGFSKQVCVPWLLPDPV
jgi:hypothetical protein